MRGRAGRPGRHRTGYTPSHSSRSLKTSSTNTENWRGKSLKTYGRKITKNWKKSQKIITYLSISEVREVAIVGIHPEISVNFNQILHELFLFYIIDTK